MTSKPRLRNGWVVAVAVLLMPPALAQHDDQRDEEAQVPPEEKNEPVFSLNISSQLLHQGIDLLVEKRLTKDYGFDEFQAEEMRLLLHERLPKFLVEHQAELEMLVTEWLEAASAPEPPTVDFAADWAARLRPIVEEAEVMADELAEEMREFLNDDQQVLLGGFQAGIHAATRNVKGRLYEFEQGHFDPEIHWVRTREVRRRGPEEIKMLERQMDVARREAIGEYVEPIEQPVQPVPPPARVAERPAPSAREHKLAEHETPAAAQPDPRQSQQASAPAKAKTAEKKDEWTLYVETFIRHYQLDAEQQQKARHFLERARAQRDRYLSRTGPEMERITRLYTKAKTERELATAQKADANWKNPIDSMFERLKRDLDKLPTRAQRRAAAMSKVKLPESDKLAGEATGDKQRPQ